LRDREIQVDFEDGIQNWMDLKITKNKTFIDIYGTFYKILWVIGRDFIIFTYSNKNTQGISCGKIRQSRENPYDFQLVHTSLLPKKSPIPIIYDI
jgi:hypothetical protein